MKVPGYDIKLSAKGATIGGTTIQDGLIWPREIYIEFLRDIFKKISELKWRYSDNPEQTEIQIDDASVVDLDKLNKRLVITIARAPSSFAHIAMGDHGAFQQTGFKYTTGDDLLSGALICNIYSRNGAEAELIGWIIFAFTKMAQGELRKTIFHDFRPMTISPQMEIGQSRDYVYVSISINYAMEFGWVANKLLDELFDGCVEMNITQSVGGPGVEGQCKTVTLSSEVFKKKSRTSVLGNNCER